LNSKEQSENVYENKGKGQNVHTSALPSHLRARFDNLHAINEDGNWGIGALSKGELRRSFVVPIESGLLRMTGLRGEFPDVSG
jgi:hypothetical protein